MPILSIDLQEGFSEDHVVIHADGKEILNRAGISTDYAIGRAEAVTTRPTSDRVRVDVRVPSRGVSGQTTVDVTATPYLGVAIAGDRLEFRASAEMFSCF
jgi:hypothetical protein